MINYSPFPRSSYRWESNGHSYGPATSSMLDTQERWNLAYLSHNYDNKRDHPDANFTVNVRRTTQWKLDGSGLDISGVSGKKTVASLLNVPAPRFVMLIKAHPVLHTIPMFTAYGQAWLDTIEQRSWLCHVDGYDHPEPPSMAEALSVLDRVMRK